jgi:flagellar M-ring protein FliF
MNPNEHQHRYLNGIAHLLHTKTVRQMIFMIIVSVSVALGMLLYNSVQEPTYQALDYQLTARNLSTVSEILEKAGIKYKINAKDNIIYVPVKDVQLAKFKLSSAGIQKDDNFGYGFLNDQSSYANSQFVENAKYLRALEGDLAKTLMGIQGVLSASVHIAIPQNTIFADQTNKVTASVVLNVASGFTSDKEKIRSITEIIAGSVPMLDPKDVSITDQYGHMLSKSLDQDNGFSLEQLDYQNNLQSQYARRIESLILPIIGANRFSVEVYTDLDFTQDEIAQEQYDPDKQVVKSEQVITEHDDGTKASGAPGSLSNSPPGGESDKDSAAATSSGGKSQIVKNYDVGKSYEYKKSNSPKIKSISVAIVLDSEMVEDPKTKQMVKKPMDQDKINKITSLVQAMIGYNDGRGDKVTVVSSNFSALPAPVAALPDHFWEHPWFWDVMKKTLGILIGFSLLFVFMRKILHHIKTQADGSSASAAFMPNEMLGDPNSEMIKQQRIAQLKQMASADPSKVATVIKSWVGK